MDIRLIFIAALALGWLPGCAFDDDYAVRPQSQPAVIYVKDSKRPAAFDPYYNRPKFYRGPVYYESTTKKTKGSKVYKTTTIKNEYGQTVYKETTSKKKKKKK